jgi:hypothetical protein
MRLPKNWVWFPQPLPRFHTEAYRAQVKTPVLPWQEPGVTAVRSPVNFMGPTAVGMVTVAQGTDGYQYTAVVYDG